MADRSIETTTRPSTKVIARGVQGFILFSILGTVVGMWWKRPAALEELLSYLRWPFMTLLIPLVVADYILGGLRYRLLFDGKILPAVSLWNCMRSNWANIFMGAVTPFQTGGGPAQLYILYRSGAKVSDSILSSLINFVATLVFFLISTMVAAQLLPAHLCGKNFIPLLQTGFVVVGCITGLVLLILIFPTLGLSIIKMIFRPIPIGRKKLFALRDRLLNILERETQRFRHAFQMILKKRKWLLSVLFFVTLGLFLNKYLMGYVIARALGQKVPFSIFIGLQIVQLFLIYFAPTPGASGVAELSSVWLMSNILPEPMLVIYALLWRFFTTTLGAMIGGVTLLLDMRYWIHRDVPATSAETIAVQQRRLPQRSDH